MAKNPPWSRDELILALDLYRRIDLNRVSPEHSEVVALSETLNSLPIHPRIENERTFRNPNGVHMKLANFRRFDKTHSGTGLLRGGRLEEEIWNELAHDPKRLRSIAEAILSGAREVTPPASKDDLQIDQGEEFQEGRILTRLHKSRERNSSAVRKKKQAVLKATGKLACEVCGFDFKEVYGDIGKGFAECHHRKPLSELPKLKATRLNDLAIVCANCHRMLHRARPWKTIKELRVDLNKFKCM